MYSPMNIFDTSESGAQGNNIFRIILRRKIILLGIIILFILIGVIIIYLSKSVYQADALIMIGNKNVARYSPRRFMEQVSPMEGYFNTQYRLLGTRSIAEVVINELNLIESQEFKDKKPRLSFAKITRPITDYFNGLMGFNEEIVTENIEIRDPYKDPYNEIGSEFSSRLIITPLPNSSLVQVSFRGENPDLITKITNSIAQSFIKMNIERNNTGMDISSEWMKDRVVELKGKMNESQEKMKKFREINNIIKFEKNQSVLSGNMKDIKSESRKVINEILKLKTIIEQLQTMKGEPIQIIKSLPDSVKSNNINELLKKYSDVKVKYDNTSKLFENSHPQMQSITNELNNIENNIPDGINLLIDSLNLKIESAKNRDKLIKISLEEEKKSLMELENQKIRYDAIKMEYSTNTKLYNELLLRMKEVEISAKNSLGEAEIVDRAYIPNDPIKPKKMLIMSVFTFLGLFCGSVFVVRLEKYNKTIKFVEDVEKNFPFPVIGAVSVGEADEIPLPILNKNSVIAEEFRKMRTRLMLSGFDGSKKVGSKKVLMISSTEPDEGKSMVAVNLSVAFTQIGKKVLIVDTDFSKPTIHNNMSVSLEPGLLDYLRGEGSCEGMIQSTQVKNLFVLAVGAMKGDFEDNFKIEKLKDLFKNLRKKYDLIIVDTPPALTYSYVPIVAQASNGVLYVIKAGRKNTKMVNRSFGNLLPSAQKKMQKNMLGASQNVKSIDYFMNNYKIIGIVLNKAQFKTDNYYEYYRKYSKDFHNFKSEVNCE